MELNAHILFEHLNQRYTVTMYGEAGTKLLLAEPELYIDNTLRFLSNHLYLATAEHLPQRPVIEKNVVVVCIGEHSRLSYYKEHATVLLIKKKVDFFQVYKSLQEIYGRFHLWESRLLSLFLKSPTIQDILECSCPVLERPILVINSSFQYVASVLTRQKRWKNDRWNLPHAKLEPEAFLTFLKQKELRMDAHGSFQMELDEGNVLCVNLFDSSDEYVGCLYIEEAGRPFVPGEEMLAEYLARMIEKAAELSPSLLANERGSLKKILQNLMNEMPLGPSQKLLLKASRYSQSWLCLSIHCLKQFSTLPVGYLCSVMESLFPDSTFFEQNTTILGLIPAGHLSKTAPLSGDVTKKLSSLVEEMQLCVGISNDFPDLFLIRTYYFQAEAAIENGQLYAPGRNLYIFSDYALQEMVVNSFGGFPVEAYFPVGFRTLLEHDQNSEVSYLETLSVFLEENMSYAKAARRLFIHRSTLIERMGRISQELPFDLEDPDKRLQLQIILKALHIESAIHDR
ncbi:MAG: PucR family transcriptional regulator [Lachnospiraceae bacterium]|nr:PucR family transcriptional regulator [Lachnospiraceae bacterium]